MKTNGVWVALGILCIGAIATAASCSWSPFSGPSYEEAQGSTGASGGVGSGGIAGTGGTGGGTGGMGGAAKCGDGTKDSGEACDDGNQSDGDGCSSTCQVEDCWACSSEACTPLSPNEPCNNGAQVCDGNGACGDCVPVDMVCDNCKSCAGSPCSKGDDCASQVCVTSICRSADGSPCADPVECASNYCTGGFCTKCTDNLQCKSGSCDMPLGQCFAALGEPCDDWIACGLKLDCTLISICKGIETVGCTGDHECVSSFCTENNKCASCDSPADCGGFTCDAITQTCPMAGLPDGAYCVNSSDCASSTCTGFPRRCAAP